MQFSASQPAAGWYPDPAGSGRERYWDGEAWSQVTRPGTVPAAPKPPASPLGKAPIDSPQLAGWGRRAVGLLLDTLLLFMPYVWLIELLARDAFIALQIWMEKALVAVEANAAIPEIPDQILVQLGTAGLIIRLLAVAYRTTFLALWGATPGKMVMRIRVVPVTDPKARKPGLLQALLREVSVEVMNYLLIPSLITYLMPLFNPRNQTLHDAMAGTLVVHADRPK